MYKILFIDKTTEDTNNHEVFNEDFHIHKINYKNTNISFGSYNLCIIFIDSSDEEYSQSVQKIIEKNKDFIFWGASVSCSKSDIMMAYKLGLKNFIKLPLQKEILSNCLKSVQNGFSDKYVQITQDFKEVKNSSILILDDLDSNLQLLREVLKPFDITPDCFNDPNSALNIINEKKFDLILLDIMMPGLTGFQFAEILKQSKYNSNTPVIFISALDGVENKLQSYNLGSYAYIEKPIDINTTRVQIYNVLKIKKLQDSLYQEKEKLDNIYKFSSGEVIITDEKFNIVSKNERYTVLPENRTHNFIDLIRDENYEKDINYIIDFHNIPQQFLTLKLNYINQITCKYMPSKVCISKIFTQNNDLSGYLIIVFDISQEVQYQQQKETFIATLTHDLKTPIRAQVRALELILDNKFGKIDESLAEILGEVHNSCKFMQYMTDNLLTKYKSQSGQLNIIKERKSLYNIIQNIKENLKYLLEQKNQKIIIEYFSEIKELNLDPYEIERVLNNLIINAAEYTPDNGIITIQVKNNDKEVLVSVIDNGWGIPENEISLIFNEYMSTSKKFRKVGYGLGLYICKKIVEGHRGKIFVTSQEGKGSNFTFTLPLEKEPVEVSN